jgi:hypothetical protein
VKRKEEKNKILKTKAKSKKKNTKNHWKRKEA